MFKVTISSEFDCATLQFVLVPDVVCRKLWKNFGNLSSKSVQLVSLGDNSAQNLFHQIYSILPFKQLGLTAIPSTVHMTSSSNAKCDG